MLKAAPSMALSESGGTIRRRTAYCRHLEKMQVVGARRQYAKRYRKWPCMSILGVRRGVKYDCIL